METPAPSQETLRALRQRCQRHFRRNEWAQLRDAGRDLPDTLGPEHLEVADSCAFALGQLGNHEAAIALLKRAWRVEETHRRAAALAYNHYVGAMGFRPPNGRRGGRRGKGQESANDAGERRPHLDRCALKDGFRKWIAEALRRKPDSIKDLYRLGLFEAQVESAHDKVALRALMKAIEIYEALDDRTRSRRGDLHKYYVRSLYAAGRSALRLRRAVLARKLVFHCIREDQEGKHVERLHQLGLAGKICLELGELDHAERAFRLALDAPGPSRRDYLFGSLAVVERRRGDLDAACRWIEQNVRPERRSAPLWRRLGDLRAHKEEPDAALAAYQSGLPKDRRGRHLTLTAMGHLHRAAGRPGKAEKAYRQAIDFRRRQYLSDHTPAIEALGALLRERGQDPDTDETCRRVTLAARKRPPRRRRRKRAPRTAAAPVEDASDSEPECSSGGT